MNATLVTRTAGAEFAAPDAIPVRGYDLGPARNLALSGGRIEPGARYGVHAHRSIEQITYVVAGEVEVWSFDAEKDATASVRLAVGEAVVTLPGESLEFRCIGDVAARVIFVTAPPYPPDNSDTVVLDRHRVLGPGD
ncbi:MAG TPA: cupin domain-containing protein [Chloroflexota bacterium]|nr:cupin domain-containing protein [Chloroflexota bacterium]